MTTLPIAEYSFDEASGAIVDLTGNGHGFSLPSGVARVAGHTNTGLQLTGTGIATGPSLFGQTPARSLMMWLRLPADFTGWVFESHSTSGNTGMWGPLCLSGSIGFRAKNASGTTAYPTIARPTDNLMHHYCGTWDGSAVRFYFDGVLQGSPVSLASGIGTADVIYPFDITLGTSPIVDDVRVFDAALTQTEIQTYMNTPAGTSLGGTNVYFSNGQQASGIYEMTTGGVLVQRNSIIVK